MSALRGGGRSRFVLGLVLCLGWLSGCAGPVEPAPAPAEESSDPGVARAAVTAPMWTVVRAGQLHSLGLQADGTVWAWGYNRYGQLGNNTTTDRLAPVKVTGLTGVVVDIAAGNEHSVAVKADGTVWAWGRNDLGQLGDNTTTQRLKPVKVSGLTGVMAVAAGYRYSLALKTDGTVWAWGDNASGKLGDGTRVRKLIPVQV
ncbi:MAG: RCC1 repeat-containing protein, partial [Myxococcaceae bacterium]